jgi:caffeoyl-CoA O-methyltransferase
MIEFKDPNLERYLRELSTDRDELLIEMESFAARLNFPIVGPLVGQLLHIITLISRARDIIEIGSGFGYSALWFARALPPGGKITCSEYDDAKIKRAHEYIRRARLSSRIRFIQGDGMSVLEKSRKKYDIIFNDGEKSRYPDVFALALKKLRKNGMLISDNVLWSGRVSQPDGDEATESIKEYNRQIFSTPGFISSIIPIRDGVSISVKV